MKHIDLLGSDLKSDFLCDLFETYDTEVIYEYDRTHEGIADEFRAEVPELGLEFVFDAKQRLKTLFIRPGNPTTFNPFQEDPERLRSFSSHSEALDYAERTNSKHSNGSADFLGEQRDWIRFETGPYSVHYEFVKSALTQITLQWGTVP